MEIVENGKSDGNGNYSYSDVLEAAEENNLRIVNENVSNINTEKSSRNLIINKLKSDGIFNFSGLIQNEVQLTPVILFKRFANFYGIPFKDANLITTSRFKEKFDEDRYDGWLEEACNTLGIQYKYNVEQLEKVMKYVYELSGIPYNSSIHASGVIMTKSTPDIFSKDGVLPYNGHDLEDFGFIKYDMLSLSTLNIIQYFYGMDVNWNDTDDEDVWETIGNGDTDFIFQFGSPSMKTLLNEIKPKTIDSLAEINALYRPGPISMGMIDIYKDAVKGKIDLDENGQVISNILKEGFGPSHPGIVIFQEDVMKLCQIGSGFSLQEADDIRRAMGKKNEELLNSYKEKFVGNWKYGGNPYEIWESLSGFASYAFNKSHAIAYAVIAYKTAEIYTKYKREFLQFLLNSNDVGRKFDSIIRKIRELNWGIVFPNYSNCANDKYRFVTVNGSNALLLPAYANKNYNSASDFIKDAVNNPKFNRLILNGILDSFYADRDFLYDIFNNLYKKNLELLNSYSGEIKTVKDLLDILTIIDAVDYSLNDGVYSVKIKKTSVRHVTVISNSHYDVLKSHVAYNDKYFGMQNDDDSDVIPNKSAVEKFMSFADKYFNKYISRKGLDRENLNFSYNDRVRFMNDIVKLYNDKYNGKVFEEINNVTGTIIDYDKNSYGARIYVKFKDYNVWLDIEKYSNLFKNSERIFFKKLPMAAKFNLKFTPYISNKYGVISCYDYVSDKNMQII